METEYNLGRTGKIIRKFTLPALVAALGSWCAYEICTGNLNVTKELGRTIASVGTARVGGVASAIDLYQNWHL